MTTPKLARAAKAKPIQMYAVRSTVTGYVSRAFTDCRDANDYVRGSRHLEVVPCTVLITEIPKGVLTGERT